jgi:curved DNA-binding protein CbpA
MIDLYDVLNVKKTCSRNKIKKEYRKLVIVYHPDKGGDPKLFELINNAYETLIDTEKREEYDKAYSLWKDSNKDYFSLKNNSINFLETQEELVKNIDKKELEDKKKNFNEEIIKEEILSKEELIKRMKDLELAREQDDLDNIHNSIFENDEFNDNDFNATFEASINKNKNKNKVKLPLQFNSYNLNEKDLESLSTDNMYSKITDDNLKIKKTSKKKINKKKKELIKMNKKDDNLKELLEKKMKEREVETNNLSNIEFKNFITDIPNEYSILNKFNNNLNLDNITNEFILDNNSEVEKQYQKLKLQRNETSK